MTDTQLLTLAIAIVFPISVLIYAVLEVGSRIRDLSRSLEALREFHEAEHHKNS